MVGRGQAEFHWRGLQDLAGAAKMKRLRSKSATRLPPPQRERGDADQFGQFLLGVETPLSDLSQLAHVGARPVSDWCPIWRAFSLLGTLRSEMDRTRCELWQLHRTGVRDKIRAPE